MSRRRDGRERSKVPSKAFRRLVIVPGFVLIALMALASLPLWLLVAAFVSRFVPGRWRLLRVAWFLFVYVWWEVVTLLAAAALWVASGLGRTIHEPVWQDRHYRLAGWWLRRVMGSARRTFHLEITRDDDDDDDDTARSERPALVFSRHAGPGDSFLLVDGVLNGAGRRPRIVLKDLLQLDPCVDVLLNRVPTRFVPTTSRAGQETVDAIGELAATMGPDDALVLFPEGGNFTPARHTRAVAKLGEIGRADLSERAARMRHVLPPKPTGALTAIEHAPHADVVFVGHVGLDDLSTLRDLWRGIPLDRHVATRLWRVPAEEIPPPELREAWLYDHWQALDDWIAAHPNAPAEGAGAVER
jgi:1-acyl-sn-glycerol-3-phosphate acyltransferase